MFSIPGGLKGWHLCFPVLHGDVSGILFRCNANIIHLIVVLTSKYSFMIAISLFLSLLCAVLLDSEYQYTCLSAGITCCIQTFICAALSKHSNFNYLSCVCLLLAYNLSVLNIVAKYQQRSIWNLRLYDGYSSPWSGWMPLPISQLTVILDWPGLVFLLIFHE